LPKTKQQAGSKLRCDMWTARLVFIHTTWSLWYCFPVPGHEALVLSMPISGPASSLQNTGLEFCCFGAPCWFRPLLLCSACCWLPPSLQIWPSKSCPCPTILQVCRAPVVLPSGTFPPSPLDSQGFTVQGLSPPKLSFSCPSMGHVTLVLP
jgi:hypothetical protein